MNDQKVAGLREVLGPAANSKALEQGGRAMARKVSSRETPGLSEEEEGAAQLLACLFEAVFLVAMADGELVDAEAEELVSVLSQLTEEQVTDEEVEKLFEACVTALEHEGFDARVVSVAHRLEDADSRRAAFVLAAGMAQADGSIHDNELEVLRRMAQRFGISPTERDGLLEKVSRELGKRG